MTIGERTTRFLASAGGLPGLIVVVIAILLLVGLGVLGIWLGESVAIQLSKHVDQEDVLLAFAIVCVLLSVFLLLAPVCIYVMVGQEKRLEVIKGYYSPEIIARYFYQFWAGRDGFVDLINRWKDRPFLAPDAEADPPVVDGKKLTIEQVINIKKRRKHLDEDLKTAFNGLLKDDFGLGIYMVPMVLLTAIAAIVMYFGFLGGLSLAKGLIASGADMNKLPNPISIPLFGLKLDLVSIAAIFGAYTWVTSDSITRNYQSTFHPSDLSWYALRLIIAVPLGEAISMLSLPSDPAKAIVPIGYWGAFLAFVISMFSFDSISKYLGAAANRFTGTQSTTPAERDDVIVKLPGIDENTARQLSAEGITTIAQMVSVDPIRVSIRSGLPFDFVLSLVDAAILWTYVGGKITTLREFGFKGASNVLIYNEIVRIRLLGDKPDGGSAPSLAELAQKLMQAEANRESAEALKKKADDFRQAAQAEIDQHDCPEKIQKSLSEINDQLKDAKISDADKDKLTEKQGKLKEKLATVQAIWPSLNDKLADAVRGYADADEKYQEAATKANEACADLMGAFKSTDAILTDIAEKASIKPTGFSNIIQQLVRDQYADFIRRLMGAAPVIKPDAKVQTP